MNILEKAIIKKAIKVARKNGELKGLLSEMEKTEKGTIATLIKEKIITPTEIIWKEKKMELIKSLIVTIIFADLFGAIYCYIAF